MAANGNIEPNIINENSMIMDYNLMNTIQSTSMDQITIKEEPGKYPQYLNKVPKTMLGSGHDYFILNQCLDSVLNTLNGIQIHPNKFFNISIDQLAIACGQLIPNLNENYVYKFLTFITCLEKRFLEMNFIEIAKHISSMKKMVKNFNLKF